MGDFLLEAKASAELYRQRQEAANRNNDSENTNNAPKRRSLSSHQPYPWLSQMVHSKEVGHGHHHHGHHHHKHHKNKRRPKVQHGTQHGMMIDAGSQGTRIHVYEFEARILVTKNDIRDAVAGRKLSVPSTDTRWTNRLRPGLDSFAYIESEDEMAHQVSKYLQPLFEFAQDVLEEKRSHWKHYPIYLKATGGLRTLPRPYRVRLIAVVRKIMHYKKFNPFFFVDEHARVISGEEEAIYGWSAVNFVKGSLIRNSKGMGAVSSAANQTTYGVLEMGGASAQIGFFEPNGDVMANLFKLQLGAAKHWNVYSHSFLYFGVNGAYDRLNAMLIANTIRENKTTEVYNPCLPGGSEYRFSSRVQYRDGTLLPFSSQQDAMILEADINSAVIRNRNHRGNFDKCYALTLTLMRKETNDAWCNFAHDRDCSFAGIYQPPLPVTGDNFAEFIATSNFYDVWEFLQLRPRSSLLQLKDSSRRICSFSSTDLSAHNQQLLNPIADAIELTSMCFRAAFVTNFLINGVGFPEDYFITALDVVNGQKVGWALGSMLYEINTLPWEFKKRYLHKLFSSMIMMIGSTNVDTSNEELEMAPLVAAMLVLVAALVLGMGIVWMSSRTWKEHAAAKSKRDDTGESLERSALLSAKAPINYGKS